MQRIRKITLVALALAGGLFTASAAKAYDSCYYTGWNYYPQRQYYYNYCYYQQPQGDYDYHYSCYYPSQPNYVYYYNPHRSCYWGRYDIEKKQYSLLDEKDRKGNLKDIPESAFPKPGPMPQVPGAKQGVTLAVPQGIPEPKDAPAAEGK